MSSRWNELKKKRGVTAAQLPPEEGRGEGFGLGELRAAAGMSQVDLAKAMRIDQPRVSRIERQEDLFLSTLRDYVTGLGAELEMLVRFPDDRVLWLDPPAAPPVSIASSGLDRRGREILEEIERERQARGEAMTEDQAVGDHRR